MADTDDEPLLIRVERRLGRITLNRPRRINALTGEMINGIRRALADWLDDPDVSVVLIDGAGERGLSAGADIRALRQSIVDGTPEAMTFLADEYEMNAAPAGYPKPIIAYQRGITFGGGLGVSAHCRVRIVSEDSQLAMPETLIGLWPDVGMLYRLARSPGRRGIHAALTGMAPTSVKVTLRAIRAAGSMTLRQVLDQDLRLAAHFLARPDVIEGIRAQVVDKDRNPRWQPARPADVTDADVNAFFVPG